MEGGTIFHFVSGGIEAALAQANEAARGLDVSLAGGALVVNQYLAAGLVDQLDILIVSLILGAGERLFQGLGPATVKLTQIQAADAPGVMHINYEIG